MSEPQEAKNTAGFPGMELPNDLSPQYSNVTRISHTPTEIVFDFASLLPGMRVPRVLSRILMTPVAAKWFLRALTENLSRYEATFGEIKLPGNDGLADNLFKNIHPNDPPKPE